MTAPAELNSAPSADRILDWQGALNARDAGGLATRDGRRIRHAALVRSDVLTRLTAAGQDALVGHGIRTIIDVRSEREVERDWDQYPFRPAERSDAVEYCNVPFTIGGDGDMSGEIRARYNGAQSREELNRIDIDEHGAGIAAVARALGDARPGGVLVHCQAGKDRTGLVIAVLLSLVGVADADIADDYALTTGNLEALIVNWLDEMSDEEAERDRLRELSVPRREAMLDTLTYLRECYGSAELYLARNGLTESETARIRTRLLEVDAERG